MFGCSIASNQRVLAYLLVEAVIADDAVENVDRSDFYIPYSPFSVEVLLNSRPISAGNT